MIIFLLTFFSIYGLMHAYTLWSLLRNVVLSKNQKSFLFITGFLGTLSYVLAEICYHHFLFGFLLTIASYWMGGISICFSLMVIKDILIFFLRRGDRSFFKSSLIISIVITLFATFHGHQKPIVKQINLEISGWPPMLNGFKILQLSDIHMNPMKSIYQLKNMIREANQLKPDLIVLTGDIIDKNVNQHPEIIYQFLKLKAPYGKVAIQGNHEYYVGLDNFHQFCQMTDIKLLVNETMPIANSFQLMGMDDHTGIHENKGPNWIQLMKNYNSQLPSILLWHSPVDFDQSVQRGIDLQLSGHTHAGQIPPMNLIVKLYYQFSWGLYHKHQSFIYTSSGSSTWGPPMRLFSSNEMVLFKISAEH